MISTPMPVSSSPAGANSRRGRPLPPEILASPRYAPGSWRYDGIAWGGQTIWLGLFVSLGLHILFLYGFNDKPGPPKTAAVQQVEIIQLTMPDLEEEKPEEVEELTDAADEAPAVAVPQLADVPSAVAVNTFVQPLQYQQDISANLNAAKVAVIPVNVGRGRNLANLGKIFEIAQLDRVPSPIAQPPPVFPYSLRQSVSSAQVVLEFIVDSNGDVVAPTVVSSTHQGFNDAATVGVLKWKFRPGMKSGKRVNTRVRVPVIFTIEAE